MKSVSALLLGLLCIYIAAQDKAIQAYIPEGQAVIRHSYYAVQYNIEANAPNFVIYALDKSRRIQMAVRGSRGFRDDPLTAGIVTAADYAASGFDTGHMCPAQDMQFSPLAMQQTFYTSNACPQLPRFNRGVWKALQNQVRKWAEAGNNLVIVTGAIYAKDPVTIGKSRVAIPQAFYKIIYFVDMGMVVCYLLPHNQQKYGKLSQFIVTRKQLQEKTRIIYR